MKKTEINEIVQSLKINESISINSTRESIKEIIEFSNKRFKIMKVDAEIFVVARLADVEPKKTDYLSDKIENLKYFNEVSVKGDPNYIRVLVNKHNKSNNDCIRVSKQSNKIVLFRDVRNIKGPLNKAQLNEIKAEFHGYLFKRYEAETVEISDNDLM